MAKQNNAQGFADETQQNEKIEETVKRGWKTSKNKNERENEMTVDVAMLLIIELLKTIQRLFGVKNQSGYAKTIERIHSTIVKEWIE